MQQKIKHKTIKQEPTECHVHYQFQLPILKLPTSQFGYFLLPIWNFHIQYQTKLSFLPSNTDIFHCQLRFFHFPILIFPITILVTYNCVKASYTDQGGVIANPSAPTQGIGLPMPSLFSIPLPPSPHRCY